jgi:hypothetical protein
MINGIVVLLSTTPATRQRAGYVQGAGLLFTALVTLGLDAYMFGLVTGDLTAQGCRRAWTEAMFAAGLLGLGAVSVVVAVVFLLGVFFWEASVTVPAVPENPPLVAGEQGTEAQAEAAAQEEMAAQAEKAARAEAKSLEKSKEALGTLCNWLRPGVAVLVILLLWVTARSYLSSIFDDSPPHWTTIVLTGMVVLDYLVIAVFIAVYMWVGSAGPGGPAEGAGKLRTVGYSVVNLVWKALQPDEGGETKTLNIAIFTSLGYSLASAFFVGLSAYLSSAFWNSSSTWVDFAFVATAFWVLIVALIPLGALLAPTFGPRRAAARLPKVI